MKSFDVMVLGAGMAGVSAAHALVERGRKVLLVDRQEPGEGTSYGNAGVIETDGFTPVTFPDDWRSLMRYALNGESEVHYHLKTLVRMAPWLAALRRHSQPDALVRYAEIMKPLILSAGTAHDHLAQSAKATGFYRDTGWIKLFRDPASRKDAEAMMREADAAGTHCAEISKDAMTELEPHLRPDFHTALYFKESRSVSSPGGVTKAIARSVVAHGGAFAIGDAATLVQEPDNTWTVQTGDGPCNAPDVVIALGPWAKTLVARFGYRLPLEVKRGYHRHFVPSGNAGLSRPVVDMDNGFVITPMERGIRLTSGIEFAELDSAPTPVQMGRILPMARTLFPLEDPVEDEPWMGNRPCTPDSMPVLGRAPNHAGLWFSIGHGHWGFSLGPITGRLVAQAIVGETSDHAIAALSAGRFL